MGAEQRPSGASKGLAPSKAGLWSPTQSRMGV